MRGVRKMVATNARAFGTAFLLALLSPLSFADRVFVGESVDLKNIGYATYNPATDNKDWWGDVIVSNGVATLDTGTDTTVSVNVRGDLIIAPPSGYAGSVIHVYSSTTSALTSVEIEIDGDLVIDAEETYDSSGSKRLTIFDFEGLKTSAAALSVKVKVGGDVVVNTKTVSGLDSVSDKGLLVELLRHDPLYGATAKPTSITFDVGGSFIVKSEGLYSTDTVLELDTKKNSLSPVTVSTQIKTGSDLIIRTTPLGTIDTASTADQNKLGGSIWFSLKSDDVITAGGNVIVSAAMNLSASISGGRFEASSLSFYSGTAKAYESRANGGNGIIARDFEGYTWGGFGAGAVRLNVGNSSIFRIGGDMAVASFAGIGLNRVWDDTVQGFVDVDVSGNSGSASVSFNDSTNKGTSVSLGGSLYLSSLASLSCAFYGNLDITVGGGATLRSEIGSVLLDISQSSGRTPSVVVTNQMTILSGRRVGRYDTSQNLSLPRDVNISLRGGARLEAAALRIRGGGNMMLLLDSSSVRVGRFAAVPDPTEIADTATVAVTISNAGSRFICFGDFFIDNYSNAGATTRNTMVSVSGGGTFLRTGGYTTVVGSGGVTFEVKNGGIVGIGGNLSVVSEDSTASLSVSGDPTVPLTSVVEVGDGVNVISFDDDASLVTSDGAVLRTGSAARVAASGNSATATIGAGTTLQLSEGLNVFAGGNTTAANANVTITGADGISMEFVDVRSVGGDALLKIYESSVEAYGLIVEGGNVSKIEISGVTGPSVVEVGGRVVALGNESYVKVHGMGSSLQVGGRVVAEATDTAIIDVYETGSLKIFGALRLSGRLSSSDARAANARLLTRGTNAESEIFGDILVDGTASTISATDNAKMKILGDRIHVGPVSGDACALTVTDGTAGQNQGSIYLMSDILLYGGSTVALDLDTSPTMMPLDVSRI